MSFESYSRPSGELHNKLDTDDEAILSRYEALFSGDRIAEIDEGHGPKGNFDGEHLKAIHRHIFQDIYPWAGHTRSETFSADGHDYGQVELMQKGDSLFLPASRMDFGLANAVEPIKNLETLKADTTEQFVEKAGETLGRLNYVHPFREGNGRTQRAFVEMLGQATNHDVDFSVITEARNTEASIAVHNNPENTDLKDMVLDASDPSRRQALRQTMEMLRDKNRDPDLYVIRTAKTGEILEGVVLGVDEQVSSIATGKELVVADNADIPQRAESGATVSIEIKTDVSNSFDESGRPTGETEREANQSSSKIKPSSNDDYGR